jgi:hypothetical protein
MRRKLYLLTALPLSLLLFSCNAFFMPEDRIVGKWKLSSMEKKRLFSTEHIATGYEEGYFVFNENGTGSYTDSKGTMTGTWSMRRHSRATVDAFGKASTSSDYKLVIKFFDFPSNRFIDWIFDEIDFRARRTLLVAEIDGASYNYKYWFERQ